MTKQLFIVIKHTYRTHFKSRGYWLLVLSPIIFAALISAVAFGITKMQGDVTPTVAIIGQADVRQTFIKEKSTLDMKISNITDATQAKHALSKQKIDGVLTLSENKATLTTQPKSNQIDKDAVITLLSTLSHTKKAANYGLTSQQTADLLQPVKLKSVVQQADHKSTNGSNTDSANYAIAVAIGIITTVVVMWYASMIATEIANEKSSRIMETLLAATSSDIQYFGKVIGIFALAVTHLLIYVIAGSMIYFQFKTEPLFHAITSNLSGITFGFTLYAVGFILVAVALYLVLTALIASLINDNAQVQQAVQPISFLTMIGYVFSFIMTNMPNNIAIKILSYVPFISQSMMPVRLVTKVENWPTAMISLAISFITLIVLAWFGKSIYAKNVLSYSDDKIMSQLIKNIKNKR